MLTLVSSITAASTLFCAMGVSGDFIFPLPAGAPKAPSGFETIGGGCLIDADTSMRIPKDFPGSEYGYYSEKEANRKNLSDFINADASLLQSINYGVPIYNNDGKFLHFTLENITACANLCLYFEANIQFLTCGAIQWNIDNKLCTPGQNESTPATYTIRGNLSYVTRDNNLFICSNEEAVYIRLDSVDSTTPAPSGNSQPITPPPSPSPSFAPTKAPSTRNSVTTSPTVAPVSLLTTANPTTSSPVTSIPTTAPVALPTPTATAVSSTTGAASVVTTPTLLSSSPTRSPSATESTGSSVTPSLSTSTKIVGNPASSSTPPLPLITSSATVSTTTVGPASLTGGSSSGGGDIGGVVAAVVVVLILIVLATIFIALYLRRRRDTARAPAAKIGPKAGLRLGATTTVNSNLVELSAVDPNRNSALDPKKNDNQIDDTHKQENKTEETEFEPKFLGNFERTHTLVRVKNDEKAETPTVNNYETIPTNAVATPSNNYALAQSPVMDIFTQIGGSSVTHGTNKATPTEGGEYISVTDTTGDTPTTTNNNNTNNNNNTTNNNNNNNNTNNNDNNNNVDTTNTGYGVPADRPLTADEGYGIPADRPSSINNSYNNDNSNNNSYSNNNTDNSNHSNYGLASDRQMSGDVEGYGVAADRSVSDQGYGVPEDRSTIGSTPAATMIDNNNDNANDNDNDNDSDGDGVEVRMDDVVVGQTVSAFFSAHGGYCSATVTMKHPEVNLDNPEQSLSVVFVGYESKGVMVVPLESVKLIPPITPTTTGTTTTTGTPPSLPSLPPPPPQTTTTTTPLVMNPAMGGGGKPKPPTRWFKKGGAPPEPSQLPEYVNLEPDVDVGVGVGAGVESQTQETYTPTELPEYVNLSPDDDTAVSANHKNNNNTSNNNNIANPANNANNNSVATNYVATRDSEQPEYINLEPDIEGVVVDDVSSPTPTPRGQRSQHTSASDTDTIDISGGGGGGGGEKYRIAVDMGTEATDEV